jgi:HSP20 family protein
MPHEYTYDCSTIYPGVYVPMMDEAEASRELICSYHGEAISPPVNVIELPEAYKIEFSIPGVSRENILIHAEGNVLSVFVVRKKYGAINGEDFKMHEFNYGNFGRHIILPDNADTVFLSAEYRAGILRIIIPKSIYPTRNPHSRIVVY